MTATPVEAWRKAFQRFDRLTAYGCATRGAPYDEAASHRAWQALLDLLGWDHPAWYGDSRDKLRGV